MPGVRPAVRVSCSRLAAIEEIARQTAGEIDLLVGTLRDKTSPGSTAVEAQPGLASLATLVGRHAAAGLAATIETSGTPRRLGAPVDQAAYRILQEALTNAARHGTGPVRVELGFGQTSLDLAVTNPVLVSSDARPSGGHGVIGMRERASLLGGTLETEGVSGEFHLRAWLPYGGRRP